MKNRPLKILSYGVVLPYKPTTKDKVKCLLRRLKFRIGMHFPRKNQQLRIIQSGTYLTNEAQEKCEK